MDKYRIADNICRFSKERGISVEDLAECIDKSPRQVNRYRNGHFKSIPFDTLVAMARALCIDITMLLS